jgi:hypothetical protein
MHQQRTNTIFKDLFSAPLPSSDHCPPTTDHFSETTSHRPLFRPLVSLDQNDMIRNIN